MRENEREPFMREGDFIGWLVLRRVALVFTSPLTFEQYSKEEKDKLDAFVTRMHPSVTVLREYIVILLYKRVEEMGEVSSVRATFPRIIFRPQREKNYYDYSYKIQDVW